MDKNRFVLISLGAFIIASIGANISSAETKPPKSPSEILAQSKSDDWRKISPDDILINTLENGSEFIILLNSDLPKVHVQNIKNLSTSGWFDKAKIVRVQDNYVVQWGREENTPLPENIVLKPPAEYEFQIKDFKQLKYPDSYAAKVGFNNSWPVASDGKSMWLTHCYGMVGVGRDMSPDVGTGQELYVVMGHQPRHLDRNIATVGRVISGMDNLTANKRGTGDLGFYENENERISFKSVKLASQLPENERPSFEILKTDTKTFDEYIHSRANRGGPFFIKPSGAIDICNSIPPVRKASK